MATFIDDEGQFIALAAFAIQLKSGGAAQHPASQSALFKILTDADLVGHLFIEQILDYCISVAEHAFPSEWADIAREVLALGRVPCSVAMIWENTQEVLRFGLFRARLIMQAIAFAIGKPGVTVNSIVAAELANLTAQVGSDVTSCIENVGSHDIQLAGKEKQTEWWSTLLNDMRRNQHALKDIAKHSPVANTDAATTSDAGAGAGQGTNGQLSQFQVKMEAKGGEGDGGVLACDGGSKQPGPEREPDAPNLAKEVQVLVTETVNLASFYRFRMAADEVDLPFIKMVEAEAEKQVWNYYKSFSQHWGDISINFRATDPSLEINRRMRICACRSLDGIKLGELHGVPFYMVGNASLFSEIAVPAYMVKVVENDPTMGIYWHDLQLNMSAQAPQQKKTGMSR
ncbi:unnamed protein product, partial [Prorocentrum cordatum]